MTQHPQPPKEQSMFFIDGPGFFSPLPELLAWRDECREMLVEHPNHPQWLYELASVEEAIANHIDNT